MKTISKNSLLESLETTVECHLSDVLRDFQNLSETTLLQPAPDGGWSIGQCLEHLNRYGRYYLPEIGKKLTTYAGPPSDSFCSTWLGSYFTKMMQPGKGKMKTFKSYEPPRALNAHDVVSEFVAQQETLLDYLHKSREVDLNVIRIPVSIARFIRLKLGDVLQFIIMHNERHLLQAKKIYHHPVQQSLPVY